MREKLADLCHRQWSGWMEYIFSLCCVRDGVYIIPNFLVKRWKRQIATTYNNLSQKEKDSDRHEADKFIALFVDEAKNNFYIYCKNNDGVSCPSLFSNKDIDIELLQSAIKLLDTPCTAESRIQAKKKIQLYLKQFNNI